MVQFDVLLYHTQGNVAHKVRRYGHLFVASELTSDVEGVILDVKGTSPREILGSDCLRPTLQPDISDRTHVAPTNKQIRLRRISAFLPPVSWGVSKGGLL